MVSEEAKMDMKEEEKIDGHYQKPTHASHGATHYYAPEIREITSSCNQNPRTKINKS